MSQKKPALSVRKFQKTPAEFQTKGHAADPTEDANVGQVNVARPN